MFSQSSWGRNSTDRSLLSTGVIGSSGIKKVHFVKVALQLFDGFPNVIHVCGNIDVTTSM